MLNKKEFVIRIGTVKFLHNHPSEPGFFPFVESSVASQSTILYFPLTTHSGQTLIEDRYNYNLVF